MTRIHRVGTLTLGCLLVIFGTLFLVHMFLLALSYQFIYRLWPILFISLGLEVLGAGFHRGKISFTYDRGAVFLLIILTFFAMAMATLEMIHSHNGYFYL